MQIEVRITWISKMILVALCIDDKRQNFIENFLGKMRGENSLIISNVVLLIFGCHLTKAVSITSGPPLKI